MRRLTPKEQTLVELALFIARDELLRCGEQTADNFQLRSYFKIQSELAERLRAEVEVGSAVFVEEGGE